MHGMWIRALAVALCLAITNASWGQVFTASLDGAQETPSIATPATGSGVFTLTGGPGSYVLNYSINYSGLSPIYPVSDAHIHGGAVGVPGAPVHHLDNKQLGTTSGTMNGDWRFDDATPLTDTLANTLITGGLYINIHSSLYPAGEIRGQIVPEPASFALLACAGLLALRRRASGRQL